VNSGTPPPALTVLVDRFDRDVIDIPGGTALVRLGVEDISAWDVFITPTEVVLQPAGDARPDAELSADADTWRLIAEDVNLGMDAFKSGRLKVRRNLHIGTGFFAATGGMEGPGRLEFGSIETSHGTISTVSAGEGDPVICLHGLGGTKASFMTTLAGLSEERRVIAIDFPGFGDSSKPFGAAYDATYFARVVSEVMDELGFDSAALIGNSMGGRVALECGLLFPDRVDGLVLLAPALAWLRDRRWRWLLQPPLPKLGFIQPTPRMIYDPLVRAIVPGGNDGWVAAGVDEFLRSFLTQNGRVAFYSAARNIYLDEPYGEEGLWTRLEGLMVPSLFVWGRQDTLVPIGFRRHVERVLDSAQHLELDCGHVPQLEEPDLTHAAARSFLDSVPAQPPLDALVQSGI
jgi:pimeloyl-ACP methyl ester carboxylesterase